jgi:hypothetical protein
VAYQIVKRGQRRPEPTVPRSDATVPSVTVRTGDGHKMTAQVEDRKALDGVKVGDRVEITFTEALMVTVDAPKR